ncbi:efflux RND transporter periplasmic adaptor subunit [candidate division GN15 bacterium]|nr:efflux RND transporter periplasmic adaptor subunit [candidate division GN15 bacterium]
MCSGRWRTLTFSPRPRSGRRFSIDLTRFLMRRKRKRVSEQVMTANGGRMRRRFRAVTIGLVLLAGAVSLRCGSEEQAPEEVLRPVRYQPVYTTGGSRVRIFTGVAQASVESRLSFKVAGTVERVAVKVGDQVQADELVAALDPQDFRLQVQEAEAALEKARAEARNAAANYERVRQLYENMNASRSDLDAARAADESAKAQVEAAQNRLQLAQRQLDYTRLEAPIGGSIASVSIDVNENVAAGQAVALLTSGDRLEVEVAVPEILISQIREGQRVDVTFDALPGQTFPARVTEVGVAATGTVTTFPVTVLLEQAYDGLRPGMAAEVAFSFQTADGRERMLVPPFAVGEDREGRFVFTVERTGQAEGVVHRQPVQIGELTDQGLEILDGLSDGDLLVTAGVTKIDDGQRVKLPVVEDAES